MDEEMRDREGTEIDVGDTVTIMHPSRGGAVAHGTILALGIARLEAVATATPLTDEQAIERIESGDSLTLSEMPMAIIKMDECGPRCEGHPVPLTLLVKQTDPQHSAFPGFGGFNPFGGRGNPTLN